MNTTIALMCRHLCAALVAGGLAFWAAAAGADEPAAQAELDAREREQVAALITGLDAVDFAAREEALQDLKRLVARRELGRALATEFQRRLGSAEISFEVRTQLQQLLVGLPAAAAAPIEQLTADQIDRLLEQLNANSFGVRATAAQRLEQVLRNPQLAVDVMIASKRRLADSKLTVADRAALTKCWKQSRGVWLTSDPKACRLPEVTDKQIEQWLAQVAADTNKKQHAAEIEAAERELTDLLAREEYRAPVQELLTKARDSATEAVGKQRLDSILHWTRPALVAEIWSDRQNVTVQHLLVGVPQIPEGSTKTTHFDAIDEKTAHCASGNTLDPGDYPVGVAFPNPKGLDVIYHLVNLPTPRRRMAYQFLVERSESLRLAELSQRTVDRMLKEAEPIDKLQIQMLLQLDPQIVSRFAGAYFKAVDDQAVTNPLRDEAGGSLHAEICKVLAFVGTAEAIPGLEAAITGRRITEPTLTAPYNIAWLAALSIAKRDPWKDVDAWLAALVPRTDSLAINLDPAPELGAMAAVQLLERHDAMPDEFGLAAVSDGYFQRFGLQGFRFSAPEKRDEVLRWWQKQKTQLPPPKSS